jgi:mannose-6-phosphate isomerase class I
MSELLFMKPFCREVIWGGTALHDRYGYETEGDHTGEAWVISDRPEGQSVVINGEFKGKTLKELWDDHRELFGNIEGDDFPLLIKLIDAHDHLSVQVHPDDEYAKANENDVGKTECWYVVDCDEKADIVIGHNAKTRDELKKMIPLGKKIHKTNLISSKGKPYESDLWIKRDSKYGYVITFKD